MIFIPIIALALFCLFLVTVLSGNKKQEQPGESAQLNDLETMASGAGIKPATIKRLFSVFSDLHSSGVSAASANYFFDAESKTLK